MESLNNLKAFFEKEPGLAFVIDIATEKITVTSQITNSLFARDSILVFSNAKDFLKKYAIKLPNKSRIICLSTLKKILAKDNREELLLPSFSSKEEALLWLKKALESSFSRISKTKTERLCALECQVVIATLAMERKGIFFNRALWQANLSQIESENFSLQEKLKKHLIKKDGFLLFGQDSIDLNNHKETKLALEEMLGRKLLSTSHADLKDINHEVCQNLIRYRENQRMLSTYGENFLAKIKDNRVFGNFTPISSASGRFSCHDPNLLALPQEPAFQACLVPPVPRRLLHCDYGAFELRILAALSEDSGMLAIFNDNRDIHSMVGEAIFKTEVSKSKNPHLRDQAKVLNFGIVYGMGEKTLSEKLKISKSAAEQLLKNYFARFKKVHEYLRHLEEVAKTRGYATTALGRRAYFSVQDDRDQGYFKRLAKNIPIQGTGADIVKLAFCNVHQALEANADASVVNVIHDEIVVECDQNDVVGVSNIVQREMDNAFRCILPSVSSEISLS